MKGCKNKSIFAVQASYMVIGMNSVRICYKGAILGSINYVTNIT